MAKIFACEDHILEIGRANARLVEPSHCAVCYMNKVREESKVCGEVSADNPRVRKAFGF